MTAPVNLHAELTAAVRDAAGAWRFVRRFAARYATPLTAGDGCDEAELRAAEARLGFALPAALRHAYTLIGRRADLTRVQDRLLDPGDLRVDDSGTVLMFRVENQHVERRFRRLPVPDYPLWALPDGPPMRWFAGSGAILRDDAGTWLWARAGSADGLAAVRRAVPGDWMTGDAYRPAGVGA